MTLDQKRIVIAVLAIFFLLSLILVQSLEVARRYAEVGLAQANVAVPATSQNCVECHGQSTPGIVAHWRGSTHARTGVGCLECHQARDGDADGFSHYGRLIAAVVTPRDCSRCHQQIVDEFSRSHHAAAGNILASLDNFLAETVEGSRVPFDPHSPTPGLAVTEVNGLASAFSGCQQCHGSKLALQSTSGGTVTVDDLAPDENGFPTNAEAVASILKNESGKPLFYSASWPNTGIGRLNLDGSRGSCSACHSRHDFSPRRARQPENCGKCHLGPDHPQKEIYEESKHGVAYRDLREQMNLDAQEWVLGKDYSQAPTCATCHMSGNMRNDGRITHDPGQRISWTNRPPVSLVMDTDENHAIVTATDPAERRRLITDTAEAKRNRMKNVCSHCHTPDYINAFYQQYDDFVVLYNEKFAKPGQKIMAALEQHGLLTPTQFDEKIEWTWFYLWHHEGRRARHGVSMMAPDYTHWHGMYEVAERFYMELIPEARHLAEEARADGRSEAARAVNQAIDDILARPEHAWFEEGADEAARRIREAMEERYGQTR
ncbi:MAG TPA: multiheme c-type cytochrome [Vicinamibacteria bacterium]|nr:multiheme c-type cytochrome [Vicinamibacteria bacterium]